MRETIVSPGLTDSSISILIDHFLRTLYFFTADMFPRTASLACVHLFSLCDTPEPMRFGFSFPLTGGRARRARGSVRRASRGNAETRCHDIREQPPSLCARCE